MKTELSLSEVKTAALGILKQFDSFCEHHNIRYFLSNGTLLGAVKYGGFIPWDDDIDVLVPREDYNRLLKEFEDTETYRLFSPERVDNYLYPFAKLCDMRTVKEENNMDNGVALGLDIDIFPLDSCTEHILKPSVQSRIKMFQIGCILSKFRSSQGKPIHKRCVIALCRVLGFRFFSRCLTGLVNSERKKGSSHCGCLMWPIYGAREIVSADVFAETVEVEFEGRRFPAPKGYDSYLRSLYGDYPQDPPPEKQKSHHQYRAYRL